MCDFYIQASKIIDQLILKKGSIKGLAYKDDSKTSKTSYALVCETLKYKDVIDELISTIKGIESEKNLKYSLLLVMIYELLFSEKKNIQGGGLAKKTLLTYKTQLISSLARLKIKNKVVEEKDLLPDHIKNPVTLPRYVRINTLKSKDQSQLDQFIKNTIKSFESEGYEFLGINKTTSDLVEKCQAKQFYQDKDFKEILIFNSQVDLHDHKLLVSGDIILQDKASCLPSYVLNPPENCTVIDSCSAPGNKTSLLSSIMKNTGKIFAIEKDKHRLGTLIKLTTRSNCKNIETINDSFLNLKWDDPKFKDVEYILCDPSCSGSGIVNRLDYLLPSLRNAEMDENGSDDVIVGGNKEDSKKDNKKDNKKEEKSKGKDIKKRKRQTKQDQEKEMKMAQEKKEKEEKQVKVLEEQKRNQMLADFQLSIIKHAFGFPNVKKVVYSTCSIHQVENEDVVKRALDELNKDGETWKLVNILPNWKESRGLELFDSSTHTVRLSPQKDQTIGFYVALFEKLPKNLSLTPKPIIITTKQEIQVEIKEKKEKIVVLEEEKEQEKKEINEIPKAPTGNVSLFGDFVGVPIGCSTKRMENIKAKNIANPNGDNKNKNNKNKNNNYSRKENGKAPLKKFKSK